MSDKKFKRNNIGEFMHYATNDGEGGGGIIVKREPYKAWIQCEVMDEVIEVDLRKRSP